MTTRMEALAALAYIENRLCSCDAMIGRTCVLHECNGVRIVRSFINDTEEKVAGGPLKARSGDCLHTIFALIFVPSTHSSAVLCRFEVCISCKRIRYGSEWRLPETQLETAMIEDLTEKL